MLLASQMREQKFISKILVKKDISYMFFSFVTASLLHILRTQEQLIINFVSFYNSIIYRKH